jgi:hypothetical protein
MLKHGGDEEVQAHVGDEDHEAAEVEHRHPPTLLPALSQAQVGFVHEAVPGLAPGAADEDEEGEAEGGEVGVLVEEGPEGEGGEEMHPRDGVDVVDEEEEHAW